MQPTAPPLAGRVALVTGVSRRKGIGFAVAGRLAGLGADLAIHSFAPYDRAQPWGADADGPAVLAAELRALGDPAVDLAALPWTPRPFFEGLAAAYPDVAVTADRVRFYRGTFALQEALFGVEQGDESAFRAGIGPYR
jgi:NAD(P)-dependent dehydrogenase (short-subunit alcohol dehydrogenase family)